MGKAPVWKKIPRKKYDAVENFLRIRESRCVAACARFLQMKGRRDHAWILPGSETPALLLHSNRSLYPVFNGRKDIPLPGFLNRFLIKASIHAVQGLTGDAEILETVMESRGYYPGERIDYDLMALDADPSPLCFRRGPPNLVIRPPEKKDADELFVLQAAYEQEEVLPQSAVFSPAACRLNLEHLMSSERMLVACLGSQIVGKINTSAVSFNRYQVGGVYVRPDCRGLGIAARMIAIFINILRGEGRGVTLFVKKRNAAARAVYRRVGFTIQGGYRITYY